MLDSKSGTSSKNVQPYVEGSSLGRLHIVKKSSNDPSKHRRTSLEDLALQGFSIGRLIGEGSYSKVKYAKYGGEIIAVKVIPRDKLSIEFAAKFLPREINVLSKERARLMEGEACHYFRQMVSALQYLHQLNVAHRDLKCENIMITEEDEVKIIDFGFCRCTVNKNGKRELSRTFCGSTAYAAPEVLQGNPYNPMMYDVWSLGCVLFIMLTGTMPFDESNLMRMVKFQLKRKIRYPSTLSISNSVKNLIAHMLEPDVTNRHTMNQVGRSNWIQDNKDKFQPANGFRGDRDSITAHASTRNVAPNNIVPSGRHTMSVKESDEFDIFSNL